MPCLGFEPETSDNRTEVWNDMRTYTLELHCPDIHLQVDGMMIEQTLSSSPGIDTVRVDWNSSDVFVTTANQDGGEDVIQRLDKAGFPVERAIRA